MTAATAAILAGIAGVLVGFLTGSFLQFRADCAQISRNRARRKRKAARQRKAQCVQAKRREIFDALTNDTIRIPVGDER